MPLDNSYNTYKFIKKNLIHLHISANWSESSLSTWIKAWILGYLKSPQLAWVAQLNVCLTVEQAFAGLTPGESATFFCGDWSWNIFYGHSLHSADSRMAVVSFWQKNVHNID